MSSTICLIAKNEERAIAEWLAYQCIVGFDKVVVYDNGSTDRTASLIARAAESDKRISCIPWPDQPGRRPQISAYADAIERCNTDWIAFFDTDEFFLPIKVPTVNEYLETMRPEISAVAINWLVFGSSGLVDVTDGLVIDRFIRCAPTNHGKNRIIKSIVRPAAVEKMAVHAASLKYGEYADSLGRAVQIQNEWKTPTVCHAGAQLNHYLLKSREEFLLKKARGHSSRSPEEKDKFTHIDDEYWTHHDLNDAEDREIQRWRDAVSSKLDAWNVGKAREILR